jgi:hypothetical protein
MRALRWALTSAVVSAVVIAVGGNASKAVPSIGVDNVAVIVVDSFQAVPKEPEKALSSANCPYAPEDVNVVGDQGAGDDLPAGVAHGEVVYSLLTSLLDATPGLIHTVARPKGDYGVEAPGIGNVTAWSYQGKNVVLVAMDHDHSTTGDLAVRLRSLTDAMLASPVPFKRIVLNMSFVIAPCNVPQWLDSIGEFSVEATLEAYQKLIDGQPGLSRFQAALDDLVSDLAGRRDRILRGDPADGLEVIRRRVAISEFYGQIVRQNGGSVRGRLAEDPLKTTLTKDLNVNGRRVIPVGAAGNGVLLVYEGMLLRFRFDFPFAPAIWNSVVSASASDGRQGARAGYSNSGEVMLDGDLAYGSSFLQGTSFATPRLSARQAAYLLTGGYSGCNGYLPTLGYANSDLSVTAWNDLSLGAAISAYCPDFLARPTS